MTSDDWLSPRRCLREPIPEISETATLLHRATDAHLAGKREEAERLIREADSGAVRDWAAPLLGTDKQYPERKEYLRVRSVPDQPPVLPKAERIATRMPTVEQRAQLIARYGHQCAFCGIPLIRAEVRNAFHFAYPEAVYWGKESHAAFWCMWLQYDHILPHARGGDNSLENLVITCSGCNYGRMSLTLEEVGLLDPRVGSPQKIDWDGLERFLRLGRT